MQFSSRFATRVSMLALVATAGAPALAQEIADDPPATGQAQDPDSENVGTEIIVTAQRSRGSVDTDVPPVLELDEADIASYGADSLADLITQLSPQTSSGRSRGGGQPVVLVNGQRVASFRELRRYPPEAIEKVEVFPEEVALQYGFRADQRVINFILKDNFSSREVELEYGASLEGGADNGEVEVSQLFIAGPKRINIAGEFNTQSMLTEAERDVIQTPGSQPTVASDPDPAAFRSLRGESESYQLEGSFNLGLGEGADSKAISLNLSAAQTNSRSLSGLETVTLVAPGGDSEVRAVDADPLTRLSRSTSVSGGGSYRQPIGDFEFDLTLDASHVESESDIDRRRDLTPLVTQAAAGAFPIDGALPTVSTNGFDRASSRTTSAAARSTLRGSPLLLPAGEMNLTLAAGYDWQQIVSEDTRTALGETVLRRGDINGAANLTIPLASEREGFLGFLGELNLNLSGDINHLSDFGTLTGTTVGLTWEPLEGLTFQATTINREAAPGLSQLGDPVVQTFNVPLFDFATGDSVLATVTSGGNPLLPASSQNDLKLSANYQLDLFERTNLLFEYNRNRSENTTESFPLLTAEIEAAFPGRVTRDGSGRLTALDQRPITYAERNSERIRYGFNMFGRVGKAQEAPQGGGDGRRGPGGPGAGGSGGQMRMDPAQFQQMREKFCATEPGTAPDLSALPPFIRDRLTNEDGSVNEERVAQARERFCNTEGPGMGAPGGPGMFNPEQVAAIRETLCVAPGGDTPLDISKLPEPLRQRLTNEDGSINEERLARVRQAICQGENAESQEGQRGGGRRGGGRRGGGGGPFGGGDGQGRWFLSLYHSIELENEALIAPGIPVIDYFDLGLPRHSVDLEGGVFYKGLGTRLSGRYRSAYTIEGSDPSGANDLSFGDLVTFDLRFFMNLEEQGWLVGDEPGFFKGTRFSLGVDNIFNTRQDVVDGTGVTPIRFQPALIDPMGRTVEIEFRKLF
ncbi:MAG: hypothetical protein CL808_07145 [Citromicrobium sp.]|nr:hypothetical protein [Citromicrobium sp.]